MHLHVGHLRRGQQVAQQGHFFLARGAKGEGLAVKSVCEAGQIGRPGGHEALGLPGIDASSQAGLHRQRQIEDGAQLVQRAQRLHLAAGHDGHAVHAVLQLGQDVRGEHDGQPLVAQLGQRVPEKVDGVRVQPRGGFIQKQHARLTQQRLRKAQALAHALGVGAHRLFARRAQAHALQQRGAACRVHALEARKKAQRFQAAEVVPQGHVFGQVADAAPHFARGAAVHGLAAHFNAAAGGRKQAEHHLEQGAFACAVVADQAEHFAAPDVERNIVHGGEAVKAFGDAAQANDGVAPAGAAAGFIGHWGFPFARVRAIWPIRWSAAACGGGFPRRWARAAPETAGPPGAAPARQGCPAAFARQGSAS